MYPVGAIYMSVNDTDPSLLFGGTWEQINGRFLLAAGGKYTAGDTGGEATHKLTVAEMPSHTHTFNAWINNTTNPQHSQTGETAYKNAVSSGTTNSTGGSAAHNNMPPYLVVYVWKRTA